MHERQTARMRTRSEWFLSGGDRVESLDVSNDMHLRPPIGHPGIGTYRSQDDLTRYRNDINLITFELFFFLCNFIYYMLMHCSICYSKHFFYQTKTYYIFFLHFSMFVWDMDLFYWMSSNFSFLHRFFLFSIHIILKRHWQTLHGYTDTVY